MPQILLLSLDEDKYYEWKKVKKACKKVKSIMAWMLSMSSMSVEVVKAFRKDLLAVCDEVKQQVSSSKASPSTQKGSFREVLLSDKHHCRLCKELCDMETPFVDNGNMKRFHKAFMNYFLSLLFFKKNSMANYESLGMVQRRNGQDFSNGRKTLGLSCPSMIMMAVVGLGLNLCTMICWFLLALLFML